MVVFLRSTFFPVVPRPLIISNAIMKPSYIWQADHPPATLFLRNGSLGFLASSLALRLGCARCCAVCALLRGHACRDSWSNMHELDAWRQDALFERGFWPFALLPATPNGPDDGDENQHAQAKCSGRPPGPIERRRNGGKEQIQHRQWQQHAPANFHQLVVADTRQGG